MAIHALGPFRLDTQAHLLLRDSAPVALGRRAIALLQTLVERPGALVSKDALIEAVWSGRAVEESNLPAQIAALRRVLGEAPDGETWIETLPGRGYRFIGPVLTEAETAVVSLPPRVDAAPALHPGRMRAANAAKSRQKPATARPCWSPRLASLSPLLPAQRSQSSKPSRTRFAYRRCLTSRRLPSCHFRT
jgi:DNA-binding winged helix-turn-helix (wHTH) protein